MFNTKSDYARNKKNKKAIVYVDAYGEITRLTAAADFASEKEFRNWKNWSDMKYHTAENKDHCYQRHTCDMEYFDEVIATEPGMEVQMEDDETRQEQIRFALEQIEKIRKILTETQFRRIWMRYVDGMKLHEIAVSEGVSRSCISDSILSAKKKIIHFMKNITKRKDR